MCISSKSQKKLYSLKNFIKYILIRGGNNKDRIPKKSVKNPGMSKNTPLHSKVKELKISKPGLLVLAT